MTSKWIDSILPLVLFMCCALYDKHVRLSLQKEHAGFVDNIGSLFFEHEIKMQVRCYVFSKGVHSV